MNMAFDVGDLPGRSATRGAEPDKRVPTSLACPPAQLLLLGDLTVHRIDNSSPLDHAVRAVLALLPPPSTDRA